MARRNRKRTPARRRPSRDPRPLLLIVTEGKITEPEYLYGLVAAIRNPRVTIKIKPEGSDPKTLVTIARDLKKSKEKQARREGDINLRYDEVWCVCDVDDHLTLGDARQMARDHEIDLVVSNPCFELWLWLHFAEQPGMRHRDDLISMLKKHIADYDKHVDFQGYEHGYEEAVRRANRLEEEATADNDEGRNPSTGVWRLTESIRRET